MAKVAVNCCARRWRWRQSPGRRCVSATCARRSNPGLAPQHLAAVKAVAALCDAAVEGLQVKSQEIVFHPGRLRGGQFQFDVGTAGSMTLVLQAVLPVALMCEEHLVIGITGGTDVRAAPPLDYFRYVFLPLLSLMGGRVSLHVVKRGYYPRGGGEVKVEVESGARLRPRRRNAACRRSAWAMRWAAFAISQLARPSHLYDGREVPILFL